MTTIWEAAGRFFGPSQNERFAQLLLQLAETAVACAVHFRHTGGEDVAGIDGRSQNVAQRSVPVGT